MLEIQPWTTKREKLLARLRAEPELPDWCELHTQFVDDLIRSVCQSVLDSHSTSPPISIIATGGYGRRELAPYSDIDLTVVPLQEAAPGLDATVRDLFRALHTAIGGGLKLEVGYAYRLVNDAPGLDEKSRTALLDARLVCGSEEPLDALMELFWKTFPIAEFLIYKLDERNANFTKFNDTPLCTEPQLKEGAGGLRCFQTANWIRMAIGERPARRKKAYSWLLQLRNQLHLVAGKRQDLLSRQRQAEIADLLNRDVYELMSECAAFSLELFSEFEEARIRLHEARFSLGGGITAIRGEARAMELAETSSAAAGIAKATQMGLVVPKQFIATSGKIEGLEALAAISSGESALRNLEHSDLLEQLLPELTRCKTLMPRDSHHKFTVYEHTLRAVRFLEEIDPKTFLGALKASLPDISVLYLALLLHDVGKVDQSRPHSISGAEIARELCARWGLTESVCEDVEWLVREHLTMAHFMGMRDILNPQTADEFAQVVERQERLDMLTLLTFVDISAVSSEAWTPAQENFLLELHRRTSDLLHGSSGLPEDPSIYRKRILRELRNEPVSETDIQNFLDSMPAYYLASTPSNLVRLHILYEQTARSGEPVIEIHNEPSLQNSELTVCCLDRPGLLSQILGVVYAFDLGIHAIRASTTNSSPAVALDTLNISFGGRPLPTATANQVLRALKESLGGLRDYEDILREKGKDPERTQQTFSYSFLEGSPSILEVQAPRGRGMAFRISRLLASKGWNINAARVGQWAGRGAAAFYISGENGKPITRVEIDEAMKG
ncbi:MAG TPA: HD domain-containing protein [Fimbriimonadaceae bacterium]|jgi:[protein-PII] uridylyltransferase